MSEEKKKQKEQPLEAELKNDRSVIKEEVTNQISELEQRIIQLEEQVQKNQNKLLLNAAEMENLRKRTIKEVANAHKYAIEGFASEVLSVVDNLERCLASKSNQDELASFYQGVELTLKALLETLKKFEIVSICPLNQPFDPTQHNAVTLREMPEVAAQTVVEVIQKGYWLKDRLLRPAIVVVAK